MKMSTSNLLASSKRTSWKSAFVWLLLSCLLPVLIESSSSLSQQHPGSGCNPVLFGKNVTCKCDATYCDRLGHFEWPKDESTFLGVVTDSRGARWERRNLSAGAKEVPFGHEAEFEIEVDAGKKLQQVFGFGGAFTDSACSLIQTLPEPVRDSLLEDYFGASGLQFNLARLPISGTDMSTHAYSYDELPSNTVDKDDFKFHHFRMQPEDYDWKVPTINAANRLRRAQGKDDVKLLASSWSAPSWMKTNNNLVQGSIKGNSSGPYYDAYARYIVKFLHEYKSQFNLTMWALTPQNEPYSPKRIGPVKINFNSVYFKSQDLDDFVEHNLIPHLVNAGFLDERKKLLTDGDENGKKLRLFYWDETLNGTDTYLNNYLDSSELKKYLFGVAIHWYEQALHGLNFSIISEAKNKLSDELAYISSEASFTGGPEPGSWYRGTVYAWDIIENLRAGSSAWIDWNLALNMTGGPTWCGNVLDSPILVDLERGTYYKNSMYYTFGHISRFFPQNSRIIHSQITRGKNPINVAEHLVSVMKANIEKNPSAAEEQISVVAGELPSDSLDGPRKISLVIQNRANETRLLRVKLSNCPLKAHQPDLLLDVDPESISSFAFAC